MRIDSSGRVGIGTTAMSSMNSYGSGFTVGNSGISGSAGMTVYASANTGYSSVYFGDPDDTKVGWFEYNHNNNSLAVGANNAERMRIDSSGNLLVGDTSATFNDTAKTVIRPSSDNWTIKPGVVHSFNRTGSDGDILEFYKTASSRWGVLGLRLASPTWF